MRRPIIFLLFFFTAASVFAEATIEDCLSSARKNYPLIERQDLIEKSLDYNISNANLGYAPRLSFSSRATYQSAVTELPINNPLISVTPLSKDQYQIAAEINQVIWDGGRIEAKKNVVKASSAIEKEQNEVNLYKINERVIQLFFSILLLDEQIAQNEIYLGDLDRNYNKISSYVKNGLANSSDLDKVLVDISVAKQNQIKIKKNRQAYKAMLEMLSGLDLAAGLARPEFREDELLQDINRPELRLFLAQDGLLDAQKDAIIFGAMPTLGLFGTVGYGRPGYNMLDPDFTYYYMAGAKLTWNFDSFYTIGNDAKIIALNKRSVNAERMAFLLNTKIDVKKDAETIEYLKEMIIYDNDIIKLRENIKKASEAKLSHGTITVTDLLRDISSENFARLTKAFHEIELLNAFYNIKNKTNN